MPYTIKRLYRKIKLFKKLWGYYWAEWDLVDVVPNFLFELFLEFYEKCKATDIDDCIKANQEVDENGYDGSGWVEAYEQMKYCYALITTIKEIKKDIENSYDYLTVEYPVKMVLTPCNNDKEMSSLSWTPKENYEARLPGLKQIWKLEKDLLEKEQEACILISNYYNYMWD